MTDLTLVSTLRFSPVRFRMPSHGRFSGKISTAFFTLERPVPGVASVMLPQGLLVSIGLVTFTTFKRFLASVRSLMRLFGLFKPKTEATELTHMGFEVSVDIPPMLLEIVFTGER